MRGIIIMIQIILKTLEIVGSVTVFIYGMRVMSDGLQKMAGSRLQAVLNCMTRNRWFAVLTGFLVTGVIQSSSATTIMVVTFVNAGLLSLAQAIGVIMGANIGTTVTGWIVSIVGFKFKISLVAFPMLTIGFPLMLCRDRGKKDLANVFIGFGLLFLGLRFLKDAVPDIRSNPDLVEFLSSCSDMNWLLHFALFVSVGAILTIVMQSSSATMAVTITLAYKGAIDFPSAAAMVLGENIGTTIKANLVSIGARVNARRAARVHTIFNVAGVLWMAVLFCPWVRPHFFALLDAIVPGELTVNGLNAKPVQYIAHNIPMHLSMFHTLFNLFNTLLFIGFVPHLARLVTRLVPGEDEMDTQNYKLQYFNTLGPDSAQANLLNARKEMISMAAIADEMLATLVQHLTEGSAERRTSVAEVLRPREELTDTMQEEISRFLAQCAEDRLDGDAADDVGTMIRGVNDLEAFADHCYKLALLVDRALNRKAPLTGAVLEAIAHHAAQTHEFSASYLQRMGTDLTEDEQVAAKRQCAKIDTARYKLIKMARRRIQSGENVKAELLAIDILRHFEQIASCTLELCGDMVPAR